MEPSLVLAFAWSVLTGAVFALVGAAGGILAAVGHISVLGLTDANSIKPMSQMLTLVTPLLAGPVYYRQGRVVLLLSLLLGAGGVVGALAGSWASTVYLPDLGAYRALFGLFTLLTACRLCYELTWRYRARQGALTQAAATFERAARRLRQERRLGELAELGVRVVERRPARVRFTFSGETFGFPPWAPVAAGFAIAVISSALGVGGGFLLVPFLVSVLRVPFFVVAGTSVLAILVSSATSVGNYLGMGSRIDWPLLAVEVAGVALGSVVSPRLSRLMRDRWLRIVLALVLVYIGVGYALGGLIQRHLGVRII